ncbi:MAG: branched-chain amino acid transaminase [Cryobacterium sp.]|nr:branched-chain amino acid transaminase [Oligoflexia bacterium]
MARGSKVWFNGKITAAEEARISLFTHGLHYGSGAFEGIRAYKQASGGGAIFRLQEHIERLGDSVKIMGFRLPYSVEEIMKACIEACKANDFEECYVRPIVFVGDEALGVFPGEDPVLNVAVLVWEWGSYLGDRGIQEGAKLKISTYIRPHPNSVMTKGKITGQYLTGVIAKQEAKRQGFDEALLLDPEGFLAEGSGENLFMVKNGVVKTTPLTSVLNGITRQTVIHYFKTNKIEIVGERFTRDEFYCADEAFMTGTAAEITPIQSLDSRLIGTGKPGPITRQLQSDYQKIVRGEMKLPRTENWWSVIK